MRVIRQKHNRKTLAFFKLLFAIAPPYRVLLDGTFVAHALKMSLEYQRLLPKLLQDAVHLHTTECVIHELEALGDKARHVLEAVRRLPILRCHSKHGHSSAMSAHGCITSLVGTKNEHHWVVASQDPELRDALRVIPGVPLVLYSQNVLVLEPPSPASRTAATTKESTTTALSKEELMAVRRAKLEARGVAPDTIAELLSGKKSMAEAGVAGAKRVRAPSGPAQPNPLSMKKKKAPSAGAGAGAGASSEGTAGAEASGKRTRRRTRKRAGGDAAAAGAGARAGDDADSGEVAVLRAAKRARARADEGDE